MTNQFTIFIAPFIFIPIIFSILYIFKDTYLVKHKKKRYKNTTYYQSVTKKKGNIIGFRIGLKFTTNVHLAFTRINKHKNNDLHIKRNDFDEMISVSLEPILIDKQAIIDEIQDDVLSIFYDTSCNCTIEKIYTFRGIIWLTVNSNSSLSDNDIRFITENIFERFNSLNEKLKSIISKTVIPRNKNKIAHEKFVIFSISILIYGMFSMPCIAIFETYKHITVDWPYLAFITILLSIVIYLILHGTFTLGINNKLQIIDDTVFPALIGLWLTFYFILSFVNAFFDNSQAISYTPTVHNKLVEGHKHIYNYALIISTLHKENYKLYVPYSFFEQVSLNEKLLITEKAGLFNANWISSYKKL